jgi:hypothetical protein
MLPTIGSPASSAKKARARLRRPCLLAGGVAALVALALVAYIYSAGGDDRGRRGGGAVDMHVHSSESDGDAPAEAQIARAAALGLHSVWLTDHDLIREPARTQALLRAGARAGVLVGLGVEITVDLAGKEHHLLGYFPDRAWAGEMGPALRTLQAACARVKESRENRNRQLVAWLNEVPACPFLAFLLSFLSLCGLTIVPFFLLLSFLRRAATSALPLPRPRAAR